MSEFECRYLNEYIDNRETYEIKQFLSGTIEAIEKNLKVKLGRSLKGNREVQTNFSSFRRFLGMIF